MKKSEMIKGELLDSCFPTSKKIGEYNVEIKGYREIPWSNDSVPYKAEMYVNGKKIATAIHDGCGGETDIYPVKDECGKICVAIENHLKEHKEDFPMGEMYDMKFYHERLCTVIDELADNMAARKTVEKYIAKRMVIYNPVTKGLATVSFKKIGKLTIPELVNNIPEFRKMWERKVKDYESKNYLVFNKV